MKSLDRRDHSTQCCSEIHRLMKDFSQNQLILCYWEEIHSANFDRRGDTFNYELCQPRFVWTCTSVSYRHVCAEAALNAGLGSSVKSPVIFISQEEAIFICRVV